MLSYHNLMVVVCQLSLRSQGVPSWSANNKIASSYREKVNWARVVPAVRPFKRGMVRINGEHREEQHIASCYNIWEVKRYITKTSEQDNRAGNHFLFPLDNTSIYFSFSLILSFFPLHALIVEERTQTWTEPWTQMLVNTFTFFSLSYSVFLFPITTSFFQLYVVPMAVSRYFYGC